MLGFKGWRFAELEWRNIISSRIMWLVLAAVAIMPLLYGALYLAAFQDPYERLNTVPVAVVNEDKGAIIATESRNLGNDLVDELKKNDNGLQWNFVSKEEAEAGIENGTYYMSCVIPEDFSEHIASADKDVPLKAQLNITYNETKNMLATQIGATVWKEARQTMSDKVVEQYWDTVLTRVSDSGKDLQTAADGATELHDGLTTAEDGSQTITTNLNTLATGAGELKTGLNTLSTGASTLEKSLGTFQSGTKKLAKGSSDLFKGAKALSKGTDTLAKGTKTLATGASQVSKGATDLSKGTNDLSTGASSLSKGVSDLSDGASTLASGTTALSTGAQSLSSSMGTIDAGAQNLTANLPALEGAASSVANGASQLSGGASALSGGISQLSGGAFAVSSGADGVAGLISSAQAALAEDDVESAQAYLEQAAGAASSLSGSASTLAGSASALEGSASELAGSASALSEGASALQAGISAASAGATQLAAGISQAAAGASTLSQSADQLNTGASTLAAGASAAKEGAASVATGASQVNTGASTLAAGAGEVSKGANSVKSGADQVNTGASTLSSGASDLNDGMATANKGAKQLHDGAAKLSKGAGTAEDGAKSIASGSQQLADGSQTLTDGLATAKDGSKELADGLTDGAQTAAEQTTNIDGKKVVMSSPVKLAEEYFTTVKNYGTGFAPYFMSLGLWVGALVAGFIFRPLNRRLILTGANPIVATLSNYLPMAVFSLVQATLLMVVLQFGLHLQIDNVPLFYAMGYLTALSFTAVMQLLMSAFGYPGKFIAIILLMLQLTACAGTFPIEMTPSFFQAIYPFMPMNYIVAGMRQIMCGSAAAATIDFAIIAGLGLVCLALTCLVAYNQRKVTMNDLHPLINLG